MRAWIGVLAMVALVGCAGSSEPDGDPSGSGASGQGASGPSSGGSGGGGGAGASDPGPPCLPGGFCLEYPQLTDAELRAVHGSSAADIWAVGARGAALRSVDGGATFSRVGTGVEVALNGVFALAPDDAWAVGDAGTVLHWDGASWKKVDAGSDADLRDVAAAIDGTVWIVGGAETGVIVAGSGDSFSAISSSGCGWLGTLALRDGSQVVAGGTTGSTACVARVQGAEAVAEYVDPHPHDPSKAVIALTEAAGQLWGVVDGYNTTFVIGDSGGWSIVTESLAGAFSDVAFKAGGGLWISGGSIAATTGDGCDTSPGVTRAIWSTTDGATVVAVGPGGLGVQVDPTTGCALATTFEALVGDPWVYTRDFALDAEGTPWFLVGRTAWEYTGDGWTAAFTFPDTFQGSYVEYTSGFAACGDGSLRLVAQYYLGDDEYGPVYQPIPYVWERGAGAASYDDVAIVIQEGEEQFILEDVKCDATGAQWFAYVGQSSGYMYWAPRVDVSGKKPTTRPACVTGWVYDQSLSLGGSPLFMSEGTTAFIEGPATAYYGPTFMVFEGETCRVLSASDWPTLTGYVTAAEDGTVDTGESDLVGGAVDDAWLAAPAALTASVARGLVELAHLEGGAWKLVHIPLPAEVLADVKAAVDSGGVYYLRPRVATAGGVVLVQVGGLETTWLLAVEGSDVQVVRGAGHSFGDLSSEAYLFASQDKLWTVEMPGTVYTRPL